VLSKQVTPVRTMEVTLLHLPLTNAHRRETLAYSFGTMHGADIVVPSYVSDYSLRGKPHPLVADDAD
jgi:hypothetical protein